MTLAGEKKCIPHTFVGRRVARAITLMSSVDVFLGGKGKFGRPGEGGGGRAHTVR